MELIKLEQVDYGRHYEAVPEKGEIYVNPNRIVYVEKRYKSLGEEKGIYIYVVKTDGGCIHISEECFNRLTNKYRDLPPFSKWNQ